MDFITFSRSLGFCLQAENFIENFEKTYDHASLAPSWKKLFCGKEEEGLTELRAAFEPDPDHMKMLVCMLHCAILAHESYRERGISENIYYETMKFLPRFVNEKNKNLGIPFFPFDWWFYRQLTLREFRIGALEYEMTEENGKRKISIHIPSRADISIHSLQASVQHAGNFFSKHFPDYADAEMFCSSWLLSPALKNILSDNARILGFQNAFELIECDRESDAFLDWIFPRRDVPLDQLAENTSLQRNAKAFLLGGGKIGWALGKLKKSPFSLSEKTVI